MTIEMQNALEREMKDALEIEDEARRQDALLTVLAHQNSALIDCQRKTADRVKTTVLDIAEMKEDLRSCVESDKDYRAWKHRAEGAQKLWGLLKALAAAGAGALVVKMLGT